MSARSRHFVNMDVVFLSSVCNSFCVSACSLSQGSRSFCHELYEQSTVMFCESGRDACFWKLFVFFVPTTFSGILGSFVEEFNSCVCFPFWSARKHTWKYVLLSALLHDQSCLQSSSCFQHQFVWLPFSRTLVCKGGQLFVLSCTWEHESRVFEPELRCCVTLAWKTIGTSLCLTLSSLIVSATITERS